MCRPIRIIPGGRPLFLAGCTVGASSAFLLLFMMPGLDAAADDTDLVLVFSESPPDFDVCDVDSSPDQPIRIRFICVNQTGKIIYLMNLRSSQSLNCLNQSCSTLFCSPSSSPPPLSHSSCCYLKMVLMEQSCWRLVVYLEPSSPESY